MEGRGHGEGDACREEGSEQISGFWLGCMLITPERIVQLREQEKNI